MSTPKYRKNKKSFTQVFTQQFEIFPRQLVQLLVRRRLSRTIVRFKALATGEKSPRRRSLPGEVVKKTMNT